MRITHLLYAGLFTLLATLVASCLWAAPAEIGETFPEVPLPAPQNAAQRSYLGLADDAPFTLRQVEGKVVLVEMLNVLCPHCRKQTKPYNELYAMIEADPATRGKIKMLGVAVANDDEAIADFVDIYQVAFPVVSDRTFKLHRALRAGPTPFSLYVLRDAPGGSGVIAGTHLGEDHDMTALFAYLKELLAMPSSEFAGLAPETPDETEALKPPQSPQEVAGMVEAAFAALGDGLQGFHSLTLPSGRELYTASVARDGRRQPLFAEVASRSAICDVCHSVHFFYVFDRDGRVLAFTPLHLTKYGNVEWSAADIEHFTTRVVGKKLGDPWDFDRKVDAVTSATMTSAIIFDDLSRGGELLRELHAAGLLR